MSPPARVPRLGSVAAARLAQHGEPLIDGCFESSLMRDHDDFAVEVVRLDIPGATLQRLPPSIHRRTPGTPGTGFIGGSPALRAAASSASLDVC